jgi:hypothetical protein
MYGFMVVADLLVRTNSHRLVGKALSPIARNVFHLDGELFAILLVSMVAGYPVGAKLIASLERSNAIPSTTARDMYCYCYAGGLAFILGTVGRGANGLRVALVVYASNVVANLLLAILLNLRLKPPKNRTAPIKAKVSSGVLVESINASSRVMLTICVMVVTFSIAIALLDSTTISNALSGIVSQVVGVPRVSVESILNALLEVSNVAKLQLTGEYYLPLVASLFSFGGVCVTLQVVSISGESFSLGKFLKCRVFTAVVSFVVCRALSVTLLSGCVPVGYTYQVQSTESTSVVPSVCLLCMSFILLTSTTKSKSSNTSSI